MTEHRDTRHLECQIRAAADTDGTLTGYTFTGIGVPYGQTIDLGYGVHERFEPGSIDLDRDDVPTLVLWRHDEPIGRVTGHRDTPDGLEITGVISHTPRGDEAATLLRDQVITRLSIGFEPEQYSIDVNESDDTETIVHTKVRALEFSLVPFPAYSAAAIQSVRHQENKPMTIQPLTRADLDPIETALQDLDRQLKTIETSQRDAAAQPRYRSVGDYLKHIAAGDEAAIEFHRAFAGQATTDTIKTETYLGEFIAFVQDRRRLINLFSRGTLPAKGMSVEYAQLSSNTLTAGKQTTEGADLAGPGKVTLATKTATVDTYGGWTELTRQLIERSELPYLDTIMRALGLKYAAATNNAMRTKITEAITAQDSAAITLPDQTIYGWRAAIIDAAAAFDADGFSLDGLLVSTDVFDALQRLEYTNVPALTVRTGDEFSGNLNLPTGDGDLARLPVHCMFGEVPTGTAAFFDSSAIMTLENTNAPLQLQDDNIINLSRAFSLYGYLSVIVPFPTAIVPVKLS